MLVMFTLLMLLSLYLVQTILAQWYDPRTAQIEFNRQLVRLSLEIDSLEEQVDMKDQFINNFQTLVSGQIGLEPIKGGALRAEEVSQKDPALIDPDYVPPIDSQLRREFEQSELDVLSFSSVNAVELQEIFFFSPLSGIISQSYTPPTSHFGVDIVSRSNEPVKCVADGTVIFADFDFSDSGYVIAVQHRSNLVSIYKHNSALLKKVGNFVSAGEIISIIGNTGELTSGPHLHFELWYNGNHINPEDLISF